MLFLHKISAILLGSLCISTGINFFLMPFQILDGGVIGIALIINYLFGTKVSFVMFVCSLPIFVIAWFYSRNMLYNSVQGLLISTLVIDLLEQFHDEFLDYVKLSPFSSAVIGGFLVGTGIGIMLRYNTSTGGTDLLAQFLTKMMTINVGILIFIIDTIIVCLGAWLLPADSFFLSIVTITAGGIATSLCTKE